jgi:hypothetical protein
MDRIDTISAILHICASQAPGSLLGKVVDEADHLLKSGAVEPSEGAILPVLRAAMENVAARLCRDGNEDYENLRKI